MDADSGRHHLSFPLEGRRRISADDRFWRKAVVSQANRKQLRWTVHSDLNRLTAAGRLCCAYVAPRVLSIAIVLSLLPVVAPAAPAHKRPAPRWHGYGFLPGYHQPPNDSLPAYAQKASVSRMARHNRRPWYIDPIPSLLRVRWRLALFRPAWLLRRSLQWRQLGPCWTRTPVRPIWNCG